MEDVPPVRLGPVQAALVGIVGPVAAREAVLPDVRRVVLMSAAIVRHGRPVSGKTVGLVPALRRANARPASAVPHRVVASVAVRAVGTVLHVSGKTVARGPVARVLVAPTAATVRHVSGKTVARGPVARVLVAPTAATVRHVSGKTVARGPVALAALDVRNRRLVPFLVERMVLSGVQSASRSADRSDVGRELVKTAQLSAPSSILRPTVRHSTPIERSGSTRALSVMLLKAQPIGVAPNLRIVTVELSGARARSSPMTANRRIDPRRSRPLVSHRYGRAR